MSATLLPPLFALFGAAFLFGLSTVFRFSVYVGFVERPLAVALIWGLCCGDWALALAAGVFFELLWMDLIGAGTYIPPNANLSLLLTLFICYAFSSQGVSVPMPPLAVILLAAPLAYAGTRLEQRHRQRLIALHEELVEGRQMDKPIAGGVIAGSIFRLWLLETLLFLGLGLGLYWLFKLVVMVWGVFPGPANLDWVVLWLTAGLGGLLSLRTRWAVFALGATFGILGILLLQA